MKLFAFGYGYTARALARRLAARGWTVAATYRDDPAPLAADSVAAVHVHDVELVERRGLVHGIEVADQSPCVTIDRPVHTQCSAARLALP